MKASATINAYNKYHKIYNEETKYFWENFPTKIIDNFVKNLKGKKVLDVGSGTGRDAILLKEMGLQVTCIDLSPKMISYTRKLGFKSILCDIRKMSFKKDSFDGIWAYTSLIHLKNSEAKKVVKDIHKILKPNGIFLIGAIKGNFRGYVSRESMPNVKRYFEYYTDTRLNKLTTGSGFKLLYKQIYQPKNTVYLNNIYTKGQSPKSHIEK